MSIAISCDSGTKWKLYPVPGFPNSSVGRESACNEGEQGSIPRSGRPPGEGIGLPTPVFWPGKFHGLYNSWAHKESDTTE